MNTFQGSDQWPSETPPTHHHHHPRLAEGAIHCFLHIPERCEAALLWSLMTRRDLKMWSGPSCWSLWSLWILLAPLDPAGPSEVQCLCSRRTWSSSCRPPGPLSPQEEILFPSGCGSSPGSLPVISGYFVLIHDAAWALCSPLDLLRSSVVLPFSSR